MFKNHRDLMAVIFIATFMAWLGLAFGVILPMVLRQQNLDPAMGVVTGFGLGAITQFFILIGTITYQFYFRKSNKEDTPTVTTTTTTNIVANTPGEEG